MAKMKKQEEVEGPEVEVHFLTEEGMVLLVLELMDKMELESVQKIAYKAYLLMAQEHALANMPVKGEA